MKDKKIKISDFCPQKVNANKHTERGIWMLDQSMSELGWIGAITTCRDNEVFDGSARLETAYTRFGEDAEPIVIESDGTRPIVVKRIDIPNADDPKAKKLSIAANRISQIDLSYDVQVLKEWGESIDLSGLFTENELNELDEQWQRENEDNNEGDRSSRNPRNLTCVCPECGCQFNPKN